MADDTADGITRLRKSGIGVVIGGAILAVGLSVLSFVTATIAVLVIGVLGVWYGDSTDAVQIGVGIAAVGAIGLFEAIPGIGLGLDPSVLAAIAIVFGVFDVVASLTIAVVRDRIATSRDRQ